MIVLDASAVVEWLLGLPRAEQVDERISPAEQSLHVPHLLSIEVAQVVRRFVAAGELVPQRGADALTDLADLDVFRHEHEPLLPTIWRLHSNLTAYDATYVALALALDAPLLTLDRRLAGAATHGATIELIA
ncbi:MAG: type II toxin-antitoxin system VapC family toxin [Ilumatobacteraceae bacterium]